MARSDTYGKMRRRPSSKQNLARREANLDILLHPILWQDVAFLFDDFLGDAINLDLYTLGADAGATTFASPTTQLRSGVIQGSTGTTDNEAHALVLAPCWLGDAYCGTEFRLKHDVVTSIQVECGLSDPLTSNVLPAITDIDTPASGNGGTDIAVFHIDTDQTLTTAAFATDGSTASMNCTKTNLGTYAPTADTYYTIRVQLSGDTSAIGVYENGQLMHFANHGDVIASRIEGGVLVGPRLLIRTRNTTAKVTDVDYVAAWQDR